MQKRVISVRAGRVPLKMSFWVRRRIIEVSTVLRAAKALSPSIRATEVVELIFPLEIGPDTRDLKSDSDPVL